MNIYACQKKALPAETWHLKFAEDREQMADDELLFVFLSCIFNVNLGGGGVGNHRDPSCSTL